MIAGASMQHKKRMVPLKRTDAMDSAERNTGSLLDDLFKSGKDCFQIVSLKDDQDDTKPACLKLNIGGQKYIIMTDSILRGDGLTFLAKFIQLNHKAKCQIADYFLEEENSYFFQRSPLLFNCIFQFYASGVIHRPPEICPASFLTELEFWRIPTTFVGSCCADIIPKEKAEEKEEEVVDDHTFDKLRFGKLRRRMWTFLERPGSSLQAKIFELSSTFAVAISVIGLSLGTIQDFQITQYMPPHSEVVVGPDGSVSVVEKIEQLRVEHPAFVFTERICIAFFTVEYCLRMFASPKKLHFMLKPLNLVDIMAIIPFYLELSLTLCGVDDKKLRDLRWAFLVVRILRILRVIRIVKISKFSSGLQTFGMTLKRSSKQLQMMFVVLLTGIVFFSTMIYFVEKDEENTKFSSIPYGDITPDTVLGKIVASVCILMGVLVLALPITIIVDNFIKVSQDELAAEDQAKREQTIKDSHEPIL
uniref:BTB domain-containing protein n=1 Tax=Rhabditophanes sp. KR3021 TaxID=114890 RepID=A0AC35UIF3_9BILA